MKSNLLTPVLSLLLIAPPVFGNQVFANQVEDANPVAQLIAEAKRARSNTKTSNLRIQLAQAGSAIPPEITVEVLPKLEELGIKLEQEFTPLREAIDPIEKALREVLEAKEEPAQEVVEEVQPVITDVVIDTAEVSQEASIQTEQVDEQAETTSDTTIVDDGKFDYIKHNDLRDAAKHDRNLPGTSNHILKTIEFNPEVFAGIEGVRFYRKKDGQISGMGPLGHYETRTDGKQHFKVTNTRAARRRNVILSAWYERVVDVTKEDKVFDIDLMLFIHSDNDPRGHFFRKINISVDWTKKVNGIAEVKLKKVINEVPLSETDFEVRVEVATQKIIMLDRNHGIVKVAPVTLGAIDARYELDGVVNSMTLLLPGAKGDYKDFHFKDSVIMKRSFWHNGGSQNTDSRTHPAYYKGRPFIGVIDRSRIPGLINPEEPENYVMLPAEEVNYHKGYRQIGFHYQIEDSGLVRGYESHGCLRLQDHDLYVLDDILNEGPKDYINVQVSIKLASEFDSLDSIYRRQSTYDKVVYSNKPNSPRTILCENKAPYAVRFFRGGYHTIGDGDCLSQTVQSNDSIENVVAYLTGASNTPPIMMNWGAAEHKSVQERADFLNANYAYIGYLRPDLYNINNLSQKEQIKLVQDIRNMIEQGIYPDPSLIPQEQTWPYYSRIRTFGTNKKGRQNRQKNLDNYTKHCAGKIIGKEGSPNIVKFCQQVSRAIQGKVK